MKLVLLLALALVAWACWRAVARRAAAAPRRPAPPAVPQPMVRCDRCGLHLPQADAVVRADGSHRCADHAATP